MLNENSQKYLTWCVLIALLLVTITVSPNGSLDPINLPKLCVLIVIGSVTLGLVSANRVVFFLRGYQVPSITILIFLVLSFLAFLTDTRDFGLKSYGVFGRNTGYLAYFFLTIMLLSSMYVSSGQFIKKQSHVFLGVGSVLAVYGLIQSLGYDIYEFENLYGTNVFSTFGNPNFHSAFMGMTAAVSIFYGAFGVTKFPYRVALIAIGLLSFWNITVSSEQGYLVFLTSMTTGVVAYLFLKRRHLFGWILLSISLIGGFFFTLALFNVGLLARFIYGPSVQTRGFYWESAVNIIAENPLFGVGFDAYGDWYRRGRTAEIASINPSIVADSAHNIPLDLGVSGGLPLLLAYIAIQLLVLVSIIQTIRKTNKFDLHFILATMVWVGYQVQSMISINSIGIGIWGWTVSGSIIGYCIWRDIDQGDRQLKEKKKFLQSLYQESRRTIFVTFVAGAMGMVIAVTPFRAANKFLSALKTQNVEVIVNSAEIKPYERSRFLYVADILNQNQMYTESLKILVLGKEIFPDTYEIWQQISINPATSQEQKTIAINELKRLDPTYAG